jgi:hypothetical protein
MIAGVIEGFFGKQWGWPQRQEAIRFLAGSGYDFYTYAPKGDASLRRAWREPIPESTAGELDALGEQCLALGLEFGIGLSPFEVYRDYDGSARRHLRDKVLQINQIGATQLCILFDDMRGDLPDLAQMQARIVADIAGWSSASRLIFCPTYYSFDPILERVFGSQPAGYLTDVGRLIDPRIDFFWTGEVVCSDCYSPQHLSVVAELIRRRPFIWDNNITNDSKLRSGKLFLTPDTGLWSLPADLVAGLAINPMNQPHLSFIALCAYRKLIRGSDAQALNTDCFAACGRSLASMLRADLDSFAQIGLAGMDPDTLNSVIDRYSRLTDNSFASEVLDWLRGEYRFDPACLTA